MHANNSKRYSSNLIQPESDLFASYSLDKSCVQSGSNENMYSDLFIFIFNVVTVRQLFLWKNDNGSPKRNRDYKVS